MSVEPNFRGVWLTQSKSLIPVTKAYIAGGWQHNDFRQRGVPLLMTEKFLSDGDLGDRQTMQKLPYFKDFLIPFGLGFGAVIELEVQGKHFALSMQFPFECSAISEDERCLAAEIRARINTTANEVAAGAQQRIDDLAQMMSETVDQTVVLDVRAMPTHFFGLDIERYSSSTWPTKEIEAACKADPNDYRPVVATIEEVGQTKRFNILQLSASLRHFFTENKAIVLANRAVSSRKGRTERLRAMYQLTQAELICIEMLAEGSSPVEIASQLGVKTTTIRQRLKSILQKTGLSSQAKLVSLYFMQ